MTIFRATTGAQLGRRKETVYPQDLAACPDRLGLAADNELRPACLRDCFAKLIVLQHPANIQRLERDQAKAANQVSTQLSLSDGVEFENQNLLRSQLAHLKRLARRLSRRQEGSNRWWVAKRRLASFHEHIANRRADIVHKLTTGIANTYKLVAVETLRQRWMKRQRFCDQVSSCDHFGSQER